MAATFKSGKISRTSGSEECAKCFETTWELNHQDI